jgi:hypothetical protein
MSSSVAFNPSIVSPQGPSSAAAPRLLSRLTGIRNSETAGGVVLAGQSSADRPMPSVAQVQPSSSSGDMLETLPEFSHARKPKEEAKEISLPVIPSRIEIEFLADTRKGHSPYDSEVPARPHLDIRI